MMTEPDKIVTLASVDDKSELGIMHLKRFWSKTILQLKGEIPQNAFSDEWNLDNTMLSALGLGIYQCYKYLCEERPGFEQFENWIALTSGSLNRDKIMLFNDLVTGRKPELEPAEKTDRLSQQEWDFWDENGYLIVRKAVPKEDCEKAISVICDFLDIDLNKPDTWYRQHDSLQGIMVQLFQHPVLQKNRQSEKVKAVYEQLWGRKDLWLNTDKVGFNPPETEQHRYRGAGLHWDVSLNLPIPFGLQGILYLTDTVENQGAFTCVPGFHNRIEEWLSSLPEGVNPREQDLAVLGAQPIVAQAGDCIIWHQALPHAASPNTHSSPRFVQYLNYHPIDYVINRTFK